MFDTPVLSDARPIAFLKKAIFVLAIAFLLIGVISSHRAYYQVRELELTASDGILNNGSVIQSSVVTSGRTYVDLQIELTQGSHSEMLAARRVPANEYGFFDPRKQHASITVTLTPEILSQFQSGPATVRATAFGHPQWTRVPPPVIREVAVEIQRVKG
jgi:hypothetical protein